MDEGTNLTMRMRRALMVALTLLLAGSGCVERRMIIRSEPTNAMVILDGQEVGKTPYKADFLHYGERELTLDAPGCRRRRTTVDLKPPWYERFPFDLFSECLWPFTITSETEFTYRLEPLSDAETMSPEETQKLLERADGLRRATHAFGAER